MILSNPGIGQYSPTMARARERRRVSREQLALAVRKHFNGLGIQEGEVVVDFLYKVRWQSKLISLLALVGLLCCESWGWWVDLPYGFTCR